MCCGRHNVCVWNRIGIEFCRDETRDVSHVDKKICTDFTCDFGKSGKVELAGVGAEAGDDHFWLVLDRETSNFIHVDEMIGFANAVGDDVEPFSGKVDGGTVGEMATVGEVHCKDRVAGIQKREVYGKVCLRTRM